MHVYILTGTVVAVIEIWIALNVMVVLALLVPSRKAAGVSSLTIFALGWMCVFGALRFLP